MTEVETKARHHSLSLGYIGRWIVTLILRFLIRIQLWIDPFPPYNSPNVVRTEGAIASRDKGRDIRVRWYRPADTAEDQALPVLINFHGSGFILPMFGQDEVIDADYRKAPENPFPLGCEDAEDGALHVLSHIPHTTLSLSGFSAGGSIALGLATVLGPERVHSLVAFYPSVDAEADTATKSKDPYLSPTVMRHLFACYLLPGTALDDPLLSPTFARMQDLPAHIWIAAGANDPLHVSGSAFVARLQREGHPDAVFVSVADGTHGFDRTAAGSGRLSPIGQEKHDEAIAYLTKTVESMALP